MGLLVLVNDESAKELRPCQPLCWDHVFIDSNGALGDIRTLVADVAEKFRRVRVTDASILPSISSYLDEVIHLDISSVCQPIETLLLGELCALTSLKIEVKLTHTVEGTLSALGLLTTLRTLEIGFFNESCKPPIGRNYNCVPFKPIRKTVHELGLLSKLMALTSLSLSCPLREVEVTGLHLLSKLDSLALRGIEIQQITHLLELRAHVRDFSVTRVCVSGPLAGQPPFMNQLRKYERGMHKFPGLRGRLADLQSSLEKEGLHLEYE